MSDRMKLYVTMTSPYARMVRVVLIEQGLQDRVDLIVAKTRAENSPYYQINPSGRVPALVLADGSVLEDSVLICDYLDHLDGAPIFTRPQGEQAWPFRMAEARARSLLDGLAVLTREHYRPPNERSPTVIAHEVARAGRLFPIWEEHLHKPVLAGPLNYVQMILVCAVEVAGRTSLLDPGSLCPVLAERVAQIAQRPSLQETSPPT